jgi:hypothetical protein
MPRRPFHANSFDELHEIGAHRFGQAWFANNRAVLRIAKNYGLDATRHASMLSDLAFEICQQSEVRAPLSTDGDATRASFGDPKP